MTHNEEWSKKRVSLLKYIDISNDPQLSNHQCRVISGMNQLPVTQKHLQAAIQNIKNDFSFVGIQERYIDSLEKLTKFLKWENNEQFYENASVNRNTVDYYSEYEKKKLIEINGFDIELYNYVKANCDLTPR